MVEFSEGLPRTDYESYKFSLERKYNEIKDLGIKVLRKEGIQSPEVDPLKDPRRSLDCYIVPQQDLVDEVENQILNPAKSLFEELSAPQVVYKGNWLHTSLFILFTAETPEHIKPHYDELPSYYEAIKDSLADARRVEISFNRVLPTSTGIILGGMPFSREIQRTRENIFRQLERRGLAYFQRQPPFITHMTLARWRTEVPPENIDPILDFTEKLDHKEVWSGALETVNFGIGTYIMDPERVMVLDQFKVGEPAE